MKKTASPNSCIQQLPALLALIALFALLSCPTSVPAREVTTLHSHWKFFKGHAENAWKPDFNDRGWQQVSIPHDWAISGPFIPDGDGNTGKLPWKGEGWYRNTLDIPERLAGKCIYLVFDGIMTSPTIYINGQEAGKWDYGYNSFYLDITGLVNTGGTNSIAIHADTRNHDSRWYPGAGVFRKIQMITVDPVHAGIWGTQVTTPYISADRADVQIATTVFNSSARSADEITLEQIISSPAGNEVARMVTRGSIPAGGSSDFKVLLPVPGPDKWSVYHGALYSARTIIRRGDEILDSLSTPFGIRTIRFTADDGFYLNEQRVQLKGINNTSTTHQ